MFKRLLVILFAVFLLTGCADNLYPIIDETPFEEETVIDEEVTDEDVTDEEVSEDGADGEEISTDDVGTQDPASQEDEPVDDTTSEEEADEDADTTETTTEDIMDDEGNDIGDVTTEVTDDGVTTTIHIDLNPNPEGVECNSFTDCRESENGVQQACVQEKCVEVECFWSSDCDNKLCFENECLIPDDVYSRYERCYVDRNPCRDIVCENCKQGNLQCSMSGEGDLEVRYCSECISDYNCNDGFSCIKHSCK